MTYNLILKSLAFLLLVILVISPCSATIPITASPISQTAITWTWGSGLTLNGVFVDGVNISNYNPAASQFTLSNLKPNETHTILITTASDSGTDSATTLQEAGSTQWTLILSWLNTWAYLILIAILCVIGMRPKLGVFLIVASVVSLFALIMFIQSNVPGTDLFVEIPFLIYGAFFLFPHFLAYGKGGYLK